MSEGLERVRNLLEARASEVAEHLAALDEMETGRLKPCPFCGSAASVFHIQDTKVMIRCARVCFVSPDAVGRPASVLEAWNERA